MKTKNMALSLVLLCLSACQADSTDTTRSSNHDRGAFFLVNGLRTEFEKGNCNLYVTDDPLQSSISITFYRFGPDKSLILICLAISSAASIFVSKAVLSTFLPFIELPEFMSIDTNASVGLITK